MAVPFWRLHPSASSPRRSGEMSTQAPSEPDHRWFVLSTDNSRKGPVSTQELLEQLLALPEPGVALVWRKGFDAWVRASSVPEIAPELPPPLPMLEQATNEGLGSPGGAALDPSSSAPEVPDLVQTGLASPGASSAVIALGVIDVLMLLFLASLGEAGEGLSPATAQALAGGLATTEFVAYLVPTWIVRRWRPHLPLFLVVAPFLYMLLVVLLLVSRGI